MPQVDLKLGVDKSGGFEALRGFANAHEAIAAGKVIHLADHALVEIGTLRGGMESGKDSVAVCLPLPDGRVVLWETSVELFLSTARTIGAWQRGNRDHAVQRFPER